MRAPRLTFLTFYPAICLLLFAADGVFEIPPVPVSLTVAGQPVSVPVSGVVTQGEDARAFRLRLRADLTDFQAHLTPMMQAELNRSDRCGERISVEEAMLAPVAPAGRLTLRLHAEKFVCIKAFGKENAKRLLGGDGTVEVMLTPRFDETGLVRLDAEVGPIEADGSLGEVLRSGSLGSALKDRIRDAVQKSIQKAADLNAVVPEKARPFATVQAVAFADGGGGHILLDLTGKLQIPDQQISGVLEQFHSRK